VSVLLHLVKWRLGLAPAEVWTTPAERDCLARHATGKRRLAEIGVWHGGTSRRLRAAMASDATLYAVDPYEKGRLGFSIPRIVGMKEVGGVRNGRVVWVRKAGTEAGRTAEIRRAPFDFVFIDNAQSYETLQAEWETWSPLVAPGGIIALHDTQAIAGIAEQSSERFAREVVFGDDRFEVLETIDSLTILRRHGATQRLQ
jgi:predicted O-methyltransferase YrrM